jgi:hypothetical protein
VVWTLRAPRSLACGLHRWQQKRNQNADDRDHHQQFHEGETM